MIETSGLALPKPLVQAFHWPSIKSRVTVDGVVAVVDGAALAEGRVAADLAALAAQRAADSALDHDDPIDEVFDDQIACADLVVLNKCDLIDSQGIERAAAAVTDALPRAVKVVTVAGGKVDAPALLGLNVGTEADIENRRTLHDDELDHDHDEFDSFVVPLPEIDDPVVLSELVCVAAEAAGVLRIKGFAAVRGKPMRLLVQAVGPRVACHYDRPWAASEQRETRLVVIGLKGIDRDRDRAHAGRVTDASADDQLHHVSTTSSSRSISRSRRAMWRFCRLPTAISPASRRPGRPSAMRCRACAWCSCAISGIRCRSICGSTASRAMPR